MQRDSPLNTTAELVRTIDSALQTAKADPNLKTDCPEVIPCLDACSGSLRRAFETVEGVEKDADPSRGDLYLAYRGVEHARAQLMETTGEGKLKEDRRHGSVVSLGTSSSRAYSSDPLRESLLIRLEAASDRLEGAYGAEIADEGQRRSAEMGRYYRDFYERVRDVSRPATELFRLVATHEDGVTAADLSRSTGLDLGTIKGYMSALTRVGLVSGDGHPRVYRVSPFGSEYLAVEQMQDEESRATGRGPDADERREQQIESVAELVRGSSRDVRALLQEVRRLGEDGSWVSVGSLGVPAHPNQVRVLHDAGLVERQRVGGGDLSLRMTPLASQVIEHLIRSPLV